MLPSGSFNVDLQADINQHIYIRTKHVSIPYTFYQINSNTFRLDYTLYDAVTDVVKENTTVYIDQGNYNVNDLIAWFASNTPFTAVYSKITGKFTFFHATDEFRFQNTSTCSEILGVSTNSLYNKSVQQAFECNYVANMNPIKTICLHTNITTENYVIHKSSQISVLNCIPIEVLPYDLIIYDEPNSQFLHNTEQSNITDIKLWLTDNNNKSINLNNNFFSVTLEILYITDES